MLPPEVQEFVERHAAAIPWRFLEQACQALSAHYRAPDPPRPLTLPPAQRVAAYLVTRFPATYAAAGHALRESMQDPAAFASASVLDLGAGTGAASLAAREVMGTSASLTMIEPDPAFRQAGQELLPSGCWRDADFRTAALEPHDIVIACYALGEILPSQQLQALGRAWSATTRLLLLIEPGTPAHFKQLRTWRTHLLDLGAHIVAPCPGEGDCPMTGSDWCHFAARVARGRLHRRMKQGSLSYEDEKFCYLAVTRDAAARAPARILRRPVHQPNLIRLTLCRAAGLSEEPISRRDPDTFRAARKAAWGERWPFPSRVV